MVQDKGRSVRSRKSRCRSARRSAWSVCLLPHSSQESSFFVTRRLCQRANICSRTPQARAIAPHPLVLAASAFDAAKSRRGLAFRGEDFKLRADACGEFAPRKGFGQKV